MKLMYTESIEQKLIRMIDTFRSEFYKLSPEEKNKEQMISSLREPCQIHILSSPYNDFHLLIKTHLDSIPDKSIFLHPLTSDSFIQKLEEFANDSMWKNVDDYEITEFTPSNFKQTIQSIMVTFGQRILNSRGIELQPSGIGGQGLHNPKLAVWDLSGNLLEIDFDKFVINQVQGYKEDYKRDKSQETKQIRESIPDRNTGLGTYFYPPILVGDFKPTMSQKIKQEEYQMLNENIIMTNFQNNVLVVTKGGLIGLENIDRELTEKIFNTIMAVSVTFNVPLHALSSSELAQVTFDNKTHQITGSSWSGSTRRMDMFYYRGFRPHLFTYSRNQISIDEMKNIIKTAETILENDEHVDLLKLLLSSHTQLVNGDNSQSFITSWTIIERNIYDLWMQKLLSARISKRIRDDLDRWDLYRVLEILHLDKIIPTDEYVELKSLQGLRNDVIHEGHEITQKTATKCFDLALDIIKKNMNLKNKIIVKQVYI